MCALRQKRDSKWRRDAGACWPVRPAFRFRCSFIDKQKSGWVRSRRCIMLGPCPLRTRAGLCLFIRHDA
jgi:hypothetical protein